MTDIACVEPAVLCEDLSCGLGVLVVALHDHRALDVDEAVALRIRIDYLLLHSRKNLSNTGIIQTTSGLQYKVIAEGNGKDHPSVSDNVTIKFEGRKIDGTLFGSTGDTPSENNLMSLPRGLAEGITLMTPGAKYKFFIPYYLAFGETGYQTVEPYSTVIFDVELIEIVKK